MAPTLALQTTGKKFSTLNYAFHSEKGPRPNNEDCAGGSLSSDKTAVLLVVADGMGGHAHGEIASRMALEILTRRDAREVLRRPNEVLGWSIEQAHDWIRTEASADPARHGMGTTVVAVVISNGEAVVAHVGDSRAMQFRLPMVRRLTRDHLFAIDVLGIDENRAKYEENGNVLSQALGVDERISVTVNRFDAISGDYILLCSDGVSEHVIEPQIADLIAHFGPNRLDQAAKSIVRAALDNGSKDNCSVALARIP